MALTLNTNIFSLRAQRSLGVALRDLGKSYRRLSSGQRLRTDDAAGFGIAARMKAQIRSLAQSSRNVQDGIGLTKIAEGALDESSSTLIRLRELAIQASNGTLSSSDKSTLQSEFHALRTGLDQIANSTTFNGISLLNGDSASVGLQIGSGVQSSDRYSINLDNMQSSALGLDSLDISSDPASAIDAIDLAVNSVASTRGRFGATQNGLESRLNAIAVQTENLSAAASRITDVDYARETARFARNQILTQASLAVLAQANLQPQNLLQLIQGAGL
ncbi:MAG: flagellin, partial [Planctomycetota bacterium]